MLQFTRPLIAIAAMLTLCACGSNDSSMYAGKTPTMTVQDFYSGPVAGYGFFQDTSGKITDRYYVTLVPQWHGDEGTLTEKQWNDQGKLFFQQVWKLHLSSDRRTFTATATMIDGDVKGESDGYALHMVYTLRSPRDDGSTINVDADDWTYLQPDGTGINKVALSKYGYHIGDVTYALHPLRRGEKLHDGYTP